jgi:opacity protein-like surface antigen
MGYNATSNNWLAGVQSELNFNLAQPRLTGTSSGTNGNGSSSQSNSQGFSSSSSFLNSTTANGTIEYQLRNYWTVSVMARLGVLVTREWLAYGLIGWSVSRFNPVWGSTSSSCQPPSPNFFLAQLPTTGCIPTFTASGVTVGGGVERDFGWIRAFLQFKYINYGNKDFVTNSTNTSPSSSTQTSTSRFFSSNSATVGSSSSSFADRLSLSANQFFLTNGVTLPIN